MSRGDYRATGSIGTRWGQGAIALLLGTLLLLAAGTARAQCVGTTCTVANATELVSALTTVDNNPGSATSSIITGDITLTAGTTLPALTNTSTVIINGNSHTLDGGSVQRGFLVYQGTVQINDLGHPRTRWPRAATAGPFTGQRRRRRSRRRAVRRQRRHLGQQCQFGLQCGPGWARRHQQQCRLRRRRRHGRQRRQRAQLRRWRPRIGR